MRKLMKHSSIVAALVLPCVSAAAAQAGQPTAGTRISDMIIYDSLTPAKKQLRDYVAELRDTLVKVESVQSQIVRARGSKMTAVVVSQGRALARFCSVGASQVEIATMRIEPMNTQDPTGDQAFHAYRAALATLHDDLRQCAHFDSLTMAAKPFDDQKLENIATAARDAIGRYDVIRDGLMKLFGITLPVKGTMRRR